MAVKNVKLNDYTQAYFTYIPDMAQHMTYNIRSMRRLSGYLPDKHNRDELSQIADEMEEIIAILVLISDQLKAKG